VNLGDGTFADVSYVSGLGFVDDGRGVGVVDWDGDGDLDLILNNRTSPRVRVMRNDYEGSNAWVAVNLVGTKGNRDAIGARVELRTSDRTLVASVRASNNYMVQSSRWVHFGLGSDTEIRGLTVRWPNGPTESIKGVRAGKRYRIIQGAGRAVALKPASRGFGDLRPSDQGGRDPSDKAMVTLAARPMLPDLPITDFQGRSYVLSKMRGRPILINLWASWCPGCIEELTGFVKDREALEKSGVQILALSVDDASDRAAAVAKARELGFWFPAGMSDERVVSLLQAIRREVLERHDDPPLPSSMLLDSQGRLARLYMGPVSARQVASDATRLMSETDDAHYRRATINGPGIWHLAQLIEKPMAFNRLFGLANQLILTGQYEDAHFYARRIGDVLTQEDVNEAFANKAISAMFTVADHLKDSAPEKAVELYRAISRETPDNATILVELSNALVAMGTPESIKEAGDVFDNALIWLPAPVDADQWVARGGMLGRLGRWNEAMPYFHRALELDAEHIGAAARLGYALIQLGQTEAGVARLAEALKKAPPSAAYELVLARALDSLGRGDEAVVHLGRYVEISLERESVSDRAALGGALFRLNRMEEAVPHLQAALEASESLESRWQLGLALLQLGRDADALGHMERSIDALPPSASNHYYFGMALARAGRIEESVGRFEKAVSLKADHLDALLSLGIALDYLGNTKAAVDRYRQYLAAKPGDPNVLVMLGLAQQSLGMAKDAVETYKQIIEKDAAHTKAKFHLAWLYATAPDENLRDGQRAAQLAEEIAPAAPSGNPSMLDLLGAVYAEAGEFDRAVRMATSAVDSAKTGGQDAFAAQIQTRLDLYKKNIPFRTPPPQSK